VLRNKHDIIKLTHAKCPDPTAWSIPNNNLVNVITYGFTNAFKKSNKNMYITPEERILSSSHKKVSCSRHDMAENCSLCVKQQSFTQFLTFY
jgi:hypothetical protein